MKTILKPSVLILTLAVIGLLTGCKDKIIEKRKYTANTPVYMSYADLRGAVKNGTSSGLEHPGKIFLTNQYIFVNEYLKGVHIIDNTNKAAPQIAAFIDIPGNVDIAVKGNYLYADSYVDLVVIDISNIGSISEVYRAQNVFPYTTPNTSDNYPISIIDMTQGVVVGWQVEEVEEEYEYEPSNIYYYDSYESAYSATQGASKDLSSVPTNNGGSTVAVAGSMARFIISQDHLYTIDQSTLHVFDLANPAQPSETGTTNVTWNIETIFPYESNLFIGSTTGMFIYDISSPDNPVYLADFTHAESCDPVVVENDTAYVTLRAGNLCGGLENQLDIIDVSNLSNPKLVKSYSMTEPYGLGIDNNTLFICDGDAGLRVYDASDKLSLSQISIFSSINAFDVIPLGDVLLMIGSDGLYQYDYSDLNNITLLSHIATN